MHIWPRDLVPYTGYLWMSRKGFGYFMCLAYLSFLITCTGVGKIFLLQEFHPIKNQRSSFLLANFFNCHPFPMESKYKHADSPMFVNKSMSGTRHAHSPVTAKQTFHHVTHWHVTILGSQFFASFVLPSARSPACNRVYIDTTGIDWSDVIYFSYNKNILVYAISNNSHCVLSVLLDTYRICTFLLWVKYNYNVRYLWLLPFTHRLVVQYQSTYDCFAYQTYNSADITDQPQCLLRVRPNTYYYFLIGLYIVYIFQCLCQW